MKIYEILNEINQENGSNYKIEVLKKYQDNDLLQRVLKMTYCKVSFTYGITMKNINYAPNTDGLVNDLAYGLDVLEFEFNTRNVTGNKANELLTKVLETSSPEDAVIIARVITRDQRINMGRSNINKVWKNLIVKPPYMRCGIYTEKTAKKINFPAYVQLKADGRFCAVTVSSGEVTFSARSGEVSEFPELEKDFTNFPEGVYIGELTVKGEMNRSKGNGMINSSNPPHAKIKIDLWDFVTLDEYGRGKDKTNKTPYKDRLNKLTEIIDNHPEIKLSGNVQIIETHEVNNIKEALARTSKWMDQGLEGAILKDKNNIFVDHTSPTQLKLKLEIDAEMRITGFIEGTPGTKREMTFGSITFENDEGTIKGSTSGFTDDQLADFNSRRDELIGQVITVQFNDISKSSGNDFYALSHPRFIEVRTDKNETDTLERVKELREMATSLGE